MRAVIVDISGRYAVALTKQGEFIKMKNSSRLKLGCEVDVPSSPFLAANTFAKVASIAASFLLVLGVGYGAYSYSAPYSYVNIDINPSIEVTTNVYDRIIDVKGLNQDGIEVIASTSFKNMNVKDGIEGILEKAMSKGYLKTEVNNAVMFTVSSKDDRKTAQVEEKVEDSASQELDAAGVDADIIVEKVTIERHDEARKQGISPGKLLLIERLHDEDPAATVEEYKGAPVKQIMKAIIENKKQEMEGYKEEKKSDKEEAGSVSEDSATDKGNGTKDDKDNNGKQTKKKDETTAKKGNQNGQQIKKNNADNGGKQVKETTKASSANTAKSNGNVSNKSKTKARKYNLASWIEKNAADAGSNDMDDINKQKDKGIKSK